MKIITTISKKGGCGKSTTLKGLAMVAAQRGLKTMLIDTDGGEPMARFASAGKQTGYWTDDIHHMSVFDKPDTDLGAALVDLEKEDFDLVLIDTKGGEGEFVVFIAQLVDFILIPTSLSIEEVEGTQLTVDWFTNLRAEGIHIAPFEVLISRMPSPSAMSVGNKHILGDCEASFDLNPIRLPISKVIENQGLYGLFHKIIEDFQQQSGGIGKGQARIYSTVLSIYGDLFDNITAKIEG